MDTGSTPVVSIIAACGGRIEMKRRLKVSYLSVSQHGQFWLKRGGRMHGPYFKCSNKSYLGTTPRYKYRVVEPDFEAYVY